MLGTFRFEKLKRHDARSCHQRLWLVNLKFPCPGLSTGNQGSVACQTDPVRRPEPTNRRHSEMDVGRQFSQTRAVADEPTKLILGDTAIASVERSPGRRFFGR